MLVIKNMVLDVIKLIRFSKYFKTLFAKIHKEPLFGSLACYHYFSIAGKGIKFSGGYSLAKQSSKLFSQTV